jgi:hypothetical protein
MALLDKAFPPHPTLSPPGRGLFLLSPAGRGSR